MASETLSVRILCNASDFSNKIKSMKADIESVSDCFDGLRSVGEGIQSIGKGMTVAGAAITGAVAGIVLHGAKWQASVESTDFLYKNLDKTVQNAIATNMKNANSIGLTERQYKAGATSLATYWKNMGMTAEESAKLSGKTVGLVADLGAVADVPFDEAMADFKSGLMGNYEALDKYGISLSANTLANSEYVKSLGKTWNQLSDNEKMMAAYYEITRQGATAQGLATQEAGSFASQLKLLKENLSDTFGVIGSTVLPYLEPLIAKIQEVCGKIQAWVQEHPKLTAAIVLFVAAIGLLLVTLGPILMIVGTCIVAFASLGAASAALGIGIGALCAPILAVIAALLLIGAIVALVIVYWDELKAWGQQTWTAIKDGWTQSMQACKEEAIMIWNGIKNFLSQCWQGIKNVATLVWNDVKTGCTNAWNSITSFLSTCWNGIKSTATSVFNGIKSAISNAWDSIKSKASSTWNSIKSTLSSAWNGIKSTASSTFNGIKSTISSAWDSIKSKASTAWEGIKSTVTGALDKIKSALTGFKPSWSIPKPKLPKISVSVGTKSVGGISIPFPKFSVSWNAKGGIFRKPTIIPTMAGMQGVGEAGAEAILPLDRIQGYFDAAAEKTLKGHTGETTVQLNIENFNNNTNQDINQLTEEIARLIKKKRLATGGR